MSTDSRTLEARAYCRRVLPRVSRTFALNIGWLDPGLRESVRLAYLLCRAADALEDSWPDTPAGIRERFTRFRAALDGDDAVAAALAAEAEHRAGGEEDLGLLTRLPLLLALLRTLPGGDRTLIGTAVHTMAEGMSRYAVRDAERGDGAPYLDDEAELHDYCWVVAGCVGVMLTGMLEARRPGDPDARRELRRTLAPRVGEALQLTNILLDWPTDARRGRCYVPAAWLAETGLRPHELVGGERPEARALAERLGALAHDALDRVADYLDAIPRRHLRYRLFCLLPAVWARRSLVRALATPGFPTRAERPKLSRTELWTSAATALVAVSDGAAARRLLGADAPRPVS
ncbi:MAG: squalene/phytoene synthase family protein [Candidatus Eisenbacteria bacterium]